MTKSQNTKNERNADVSKTLTEQWKKGKLPSGEYWCLSICGDVDKLYCYQNSFWKYKTEDDYYGIPVEIKQVLAPVPSYEEWLEKTKSLKVLANEYCKEKEENAQLKTEYEAECKRADELEDSYWKSEKENKKLKELLKECRLAVFDYPPYDLASDKIRLEQRIDEVLK